jgi:iron complex transport system permease protein
VKEVALDPRSAFRNWMLAGGTVLLVLSILFGISTGAVRVGMGEILDSLRWTQLAGENQQIIYNIRIPRVLVSALVGVNLSLAGVILQGVLRNPLADPGIIGVSAGAGLAAMIVLILWPAHTYMVPMVAFVGALAATGLVFLLSWQHGIHPLRLILAGVAVAAFFGGGMSALMVFHSDKVQGTVNWMAGGFQGRSWDHVRMILPYTLLGCAGALYGSRYLNILNLGDDAAKGLGVPVERVRFLFIVLAALLAASAVSVAGMLGFVGLIVPHLTRLLVGVDNEYMVPCAAAFGATLVVVADTAARIVFSPVEIPVGVLMAFFGAPFFLHLLRKGGRPK